MRLNQFYPYVQFFFLNLKKKHFEFQTFDFKVAFEAKIKLVLIV